MDIKHFKIGNTLVLNWEGKTYPLNENDHRFSKICDAIKENNLTIIPDLIDPTKVLNKEGFTVKDGIVYFKDQAIPTILGDQFLEFKVDKVSFISLVNFWLNLKNRAEYENSKELIVTLLAKKGYPVTEDGFILVYKDPVGTPITFNQSLKVVLPFYNYSHTPTKFMDLFDNKKTFSEIIEEVFGFNTKKLQKLVRERMFVEGKPYLDYNILNYGVAFKGLLSPNNLFTLIEKKVLPESSPTGHYDQLNLFLKDFATTKENKISESKILRIFEEKRNNFNILFDCANMYLRVKDVFPIDLESADFTSNLAKTYDYLRRETEKLSHPNFPLEVEKFFPFASKIKNSLVDKKQIVFPKENYDLVAWSQKMSNCIHSYGERFLRGESFVCAILDDKGDMLYNLEIGNGKIIQFRGYDNKLPPASEQKPLVEFLFNQGIIHEKKGEECSFN